MEQRRSDISQHQHARYRRRDGATPEIALRRGEQIVVFAIPETRLEPLGKIRGWFYGRQVSKQEKRAADLGIMLRADFTFQKMPLHANKLDTSQGIVYEGKMLITKIAAVHGDRLRVR
jgi:hypothetical protein